MSSYIFEDTPVCPHCSEPHTEWWRLSEFSEDSGNVTCLNCKKKFEFEKSIFYSFDTYKTSESGDKNEL